MLQEKSIRKNFQNRTPVSQNKVIYREDLQIKMTQLKRFCTAKKQITRTKRQPAEFKNIFANCTCDRGLILRQHERFKIKYTECKQPNP